MRYSIYCLSLNNRRAAEMRSKFATLGLDVKINPGVPVTDGRIAERNLKPALARVWSTCYGHLDMLRWFYFMTEDEIGFFCEDDILIHHNFKKFLPEIFSGFCDFNLEILALGYLCENPIDTYSNFPSLKNPTENFPHKFLEYPADLWGTQMYALTRKKAGEILEKYGSDYADKTLKDSTLTPFAADWLITKDGRRALVYPLLVIEDGLGESDHTHHERAHKACHAYSYEEKVFSFNPTKQSV